MNNYKYLIIFKHKAVEVWASNQRDAEIIGMHEAVENATDSQILQVVKYTTEGNKPLKPIFNK